MSSGVSFLSIMKLSSISLYCNLIIWIKKNYMYVKTYKICKKILYLYTKFISTIVFCKKETI